jgi:hypothetical protein
MRQLALARESFPHEKYVSPPERVEWFWSRRKRKEPSAHSTPVRFRIYFYHGTMPSQAAYSDHFAYASELPEANLLKAVLARAVLDCRGWSATNDEAREALDYLFDESRHRMSFLWICDALDLDPAPFRRAATVSQDDMARPRYRRGR